MTATQLSPQRLALLRTTFQIIALPAFGLGLAMAISPAAFWQLFGLEVGADAVVAILYGCVLMGVGITSMFALRNPAAHTSALLLIGSYKGAAFIALCLHGLQAAAGMPLAGWVIAFAYLAMSIYCLLLYPWRTQP
jgi:hypothetical protein